MPEEAPFKPNWLAIAAVVIGLIVTGFLAGKLTEAPDGMTIDCSSLGNVHWIPNENGGIAYCEEPGAN